MTLKGHIEKGMVVLDEPVELPDGMNVEVDLRPRAAASEGPTLYERMKDIIGIVEGLPEDMAETGPTWTEAFGDLAGSVEGLPTDFAENHDHYIHGTPKGIDKR